HLRHLRLVPSLLSALALSCGGDRPARLSEHSTTTRPPASTAPRPTSSVSTSSPPAPPSTKLASSEPERPQRPLTAPEARRYMLALINRDRATQGLSAVELDEGPPTRAGQAHAEDMVRLGYLGHWGSDGSIPEQRHTDAGGADMVLENALCFTDEAKRSVDAKAL